MNTVIERNLLTGEVRVISDQQVAFEKRKTAEYMQISGYCNSACRWAEPHGWMPEDGCPIHDITMH